MHRGGESEEGGGKTNKKQNKKESLYRTTRHAAFGSFGGVHDGLAKPLPSLIF